ncbi:MAG: AsmA family protein [Pseudomonadota bacterium]|nr:AsmA family protein [Pseudomonadota bacterium]
MSAAIHHKTAIILVSVAVLLIVAAVVLPMLLDANRYRPQVIAYLEASTGKKVELGRLRVSLYPKLTVHAEDFGIRNPPLFPPGHVLKVARIEAVLDRWALLHRKIVIISLVLEEPLVNLVSDPDGPWNFENPKAKNRQNSPVLGVVPLVSIRRAHVLLSNLLANDSPGPVFFEARDLTTELDNVNADAITDPFSKSLDGKGWLKAGLLRFGSIEAKNLSANIRLLARQVLFDGLKAETYGGHADGDFSIRFAGKNASFKADATLKGIEVAELLNAFPKASGKMTGKMEGQLKIDGEIKHTEHPLDGLRGSGQVTVRNGQVPSLKLNANLKKLAHYNDLGPAKDDPSSFNMISTDLELDHDRISSKAIDIDGYGVDVDGSGSMSLTGSDELDYQGVAQIASQGFITNIFARLAGGKLKDGKLLFPFRIQGTLDNPIFIRGN